MASTPPVCDFNWPAPDFKLPATDGRILQLSDVRGPRGTLIMFICNHCPYVIAILDRIVRDAHELQAVGIGVAAICANDARRDLFEAMVQVAETGRGPQDQIPSMGCSIKWKAA